MPHTGNSAVPETATVSLARWGLSATADLIYRALISGGASTAEHLAVSLGMSGRRVREGLEELHAAQACAAPPARTGPAAGWRAAPPRTVTAALELRRRRLAAAAHALRRRTAGLGGFAIGDHELSTMLGSTIRPLYGVAQVRGRLGDLASAGRAEHLSMHTESAFDRGAVQAATPAHRTLCARGIQVLSLGVPAAAGDRSAGQTQELLAHGMQYREMPALPTKLIIIDRATAILPLDPADAGQGAWEITAAPLVQQLLEEFRRRWDQAAAPHRRWTPPMNLTPRERAILALLAEGHTDEAVAAELGLSRRTIAYTVADLMEQHGACNRFQLGLFLRDHDAPTVAGDPHPAAPAATEDEDES
jgi:DNA-binding CsgD family transcriptional regulator